MLHVQFLPMVLRSFCLFSMPRQDFLFFFRSETLKRLLDGTHVFGKVFFVSISNDGALKLLRHVVELSMSVTMWRAAETK